MPADLKASLSYGGLFKKLFNALRELCTERKNRRGSNLCLLSCEPSGLTFQQQDYNHVAMCNITLEADGFDRYSCPEPFELCFNTTAMCDMLKLCKDRDTVKLSYSARTSPDILSLAFHSNMNEARVLLRLSDVTVERLNVPPLEYEYTTSMNSDEARQQLMLHNNARPEDGSVGLRLDRDHFSFLWGATPNTRRDKDGSVHDVSVFEGKTTYTRERHRRGKASGGRSSSSRPREEKGAESAESSSSDEEEWNSDWDSDDAEDDSGRKRKKKKQEKAAKEKADRQCFHRIRIKRQSEAPDDSTSTLQAAFSLRYLAALTRQPLASRITIRLSHDRPLCIEYALRHGAVSVGSFCCYVAPRQD